MGKGREFYESAKRKLTGTLAAARRKNAEFREKKEEKQAKTAEFWADPENIARLDRYDLFARGLIHKYEENKKSNRFRKVAIGWGSGAALAGTVYGMSGAYSGIKKTANTFIQEAEAGRTVLKKAQQLTPFSDRATIERSLNANREYLNSLGTTLQQYETNLTSTEQRLEDIGTAVGEIGRLVQQAPGYNSEVVQKLRGLKDKVAGTVAEVVTGKDQSWRTSPEYHTNYTALQKLLADAIAKKGKANEKIGEILTRMDTLSVQEKKQLANQRGELEQLMQNYNAYADLMKNAGKLAPTDIQGANRQYQSVLQQAENIKVVTPEYRDLGGLIALGIGAIAAFYAGKGTYKLFGGLIPHARFDTRKASKDYLEGRRVEHIQPEGRKEGGLEGRTHHVESILVLLAAIVLITSGIRVSGMVIAQETLQSNSSLYIPLIISLLFAAIYITVKMYKANKK